ncbi:hypothetical protein LQF12_02335 [Ruania suaedae]|uniref:hypothetical protein n=1 Tax=Ruania suaedae TaxID=2897774 RepID=UPI001E28F80E|nr:hypothetical protein [Ruania suaedae]UFU03471.1 hypothetical protein LQF12_02335 [Ruania suaedae]
MTAPPGLAPTPPRTSPREDADDFADACARRDFGLLQTAVAGMTKRDACDHLEGLFPRLSRHWIVRHFRDLMALDADAFWRLQYSDPTGERAVTNVMRGA